jgi:tRNA-intron endonuclease
MKIQGTLVKDRIIVEKPKAVGRLFNKSHFGTPITGNKLELDLIESCFLLDEDKIKITNIVGKNIDFEQLMFIAMEKIKDFDTKYLVFKDLRMRGCAVKLFNENNKIAFVDVKEKFFVSVFSEKKNFNVKETIELIDNVEKKGAALWYAIVDYEGDVTYYDVSMVNLKGQNKKHSYKKNKGFLFDDSIVVFDKFLKKSLFEKEFYGKPFGTGLRLSLIEGLYLLNKGVLEIAKKDLKNKIKEPDFDNKYIVYCDLKKRRLIVKTGFKFGSDFRGYTRNPDDIHAEYLVHVIDNNYNVVWSEMSRAIRLGHSVNKEIVFACVKGKNVDYIGFGRLRP